MAEKEIEKHILDELQKVQENVRQVKTNQDSLLEKLNKLNKAALKVDQAQAAYRTVADSLYHNDQSIPELPALENEFPIPSISQEELQNTFTNWEQEISLKIENLKTEFKSFEDDFYKGSTNQIFGLKKRLNKVEESYADLSTSVTEMEKWKKKKNILLWVDLGLAILILIKLFVLN